MSNFSGLPIAKAGLKRRLVIGAAFAVAGVLGACSSGNDSNTGNDEAVVPSFKIKQLFDNLGDNGISFTLRGRFHEDGRTTIQQHDFVRYPARLHNEPWRGLSALFLHQVDVSRTINGEAANTDTYNGYYRSNGRRVGEQQVNSDIFVIDGPYSYRPVSARIGDSGGGPIGERTMADGTVRQRMLNWQMTRSPSDLPIYCETVSETVQATLAWRDTWCYGITEDGIPDGFVRYEYDLNQDHYGSVVANAVRYPLVGTAPPPETERTPNYRVKDYFNHLRQNGASYKLIGEFVDGQGQRTGQRHEQVREPVTAFSSTWFSLPVASRLRTRVNRFIDGVAGQSDIYNRYFDQSGQSVGIQADGSDDFIRLTQFPNRPQTAQIGDTGSGPEAVIYNELGEQIGRREMVLWEMTRNDQGEPIYCETIDETTTNGSRNWSYTWCYGMQQNGTPTDYISFSYDSGANGFGSLVARDLRSPADTAPTEPEQCQVNCNDSDEQPSGF